MTNNTSASRAAEVLEQTMLPGERVVWSGAPRASLIYSVNNPDLLKMFGMLLLLGAIGLVLAVAMNLLLAGNTRDRASDNLLDTLMNLMDATGMAAMSATQCLLIVMGFGGAVLVAWTMVRAYQRDRATLYAVTDRRVLIVRTSPFDTIHAYDKQDVSRVNLSSPETLRFTVKKALYAHKVRRGIDDGFYRLADAEFVGAAIERALDLRVKGLRVSKADAQPKQPKARLTVTTRDGKKHRMRTVLADLERQGYSYAQISDFTNGRLSLDDLWAQGPENKTGA
ncbi:MAG: hypothetical protein U0670_16595 [Anaerolineae bacterium]